MYSCSTHGNRKRALTWMCVVMTLHDVLNHMSGKSVIILEKLHPFALIWSRNRELIDGLMDLLKKTEENTSLQITVKVTTVGGFFSKLLPEVVWKLISSTSVVKKASDGAAGWGKAVHPGCTVHSDLFDRLPEGVSVEHDRSRPSASCRHVSSIIRLLSSCVCPSQNIQPCRDSTRKPQWDGESFVSRFKRLKWLNQGCRILS